MRRWPRQEFVERLDTLVRDRGRRATFVLTQPKRLQLRQGQVGDLAGSVGRPIDALVMHDDEMTVTAAPHIGFHHIGPQRHALH